MYLFIKRIPLFLSILVMVASCRKGDLAEEHYFGKINVALLNLPGTPKVVMYFDNKKLDTVFASGGNAQNGKFTLQAGQQGRLGAYDAVKNELIIDTLITISPNTIQNFKLAYSPELGLKVFISSSGGTIPADSFAVQLFNKLSEKNYPLKKCDLSINYRDPETSELIEVGAIKGWERGKLSPETLKLKAMDSNSEAIRYLIMMKDPQSGETILQPSGRRFFAFGIDGTTAGGKYYIVNVSDEVESGDILSEAIEL